MEIVGGTYREICYIPPWNALFGSGVRAAAAVADLASEINLHSFVDQSEVSNLAFIRQLGVRVTQMPRKSPIVFVYFHPLSRPHIEPSMSTLQKESNLLVTGDTVLRFGLLEADAVVKSDHAVYDPQTSVNPTLFSANGSHAKRLSLVLNEAELRALGGATTLSEGAKLLMRADDAHVVVVKMGIKGAMVFDRQGKQTHVPAYSSDRVFKIGTGDGLLALLFRVVFACFQPTDSGPGRKIDRGCEITHDSHCG